MPSPAAPRLDDDPLLRRARRVMAEAAQVAARPGDRRRLIALVAELEQLIRSLTDARDGVDREIGLTAHRMSAVTAYSHVALAGRQYANEVRQSRPRKPTEQLP